jgi:hypothetical protein
VPNPDALFITILYIGLTLTIWRRLWLWWIQR